MVVGMGIDLVEIARIERAMENPRFVSRILTPLEAEFCTTPARVAGRWAAKEALIKAIGLPISFQEIEILPTGTGQPVATIRSRHLDTKRFRVQISITHERTHAAAVALLERLVIQAR